MHFVPRLRDKPSSPFRSAVRNFHNVPQGLFALSPFSFRGGFDYRTTLGSVGAMILTGIRRLVEVPVQPARGDCTPIR